MRYAFSEEATKALTAEGLFDADLQNTLVPTIGPRIPDKVCLSSYLKNVMRLCSLYLTPAAKLLNVLERSIMFAAYIFSVVTTSRVQTRTSRWSRGVVSLIHKGIG